MLQLSAASGAVGLAGCTDESPETERPGGKDPCPSSSSGLAPLALSTGGVPPVRSSTPGEGSVSVTSPSVAQPSQGVPLGEVPTELHRRAAQLLERVRGSDAAPGWQAARLRDVAYRFFRPDLEGVAYYEFDVDPEGFLVLAADVHDFPVAHWSPAGPSVSRRLEALAEESGRSVSRRYKLDTLAYAAENEVGELVAAIGPPVFRIEGMRREWLEEEPPVRRTAVVPTGEVPSDAEVDEDLEYTVRRSGPELTVELEPWESWGELKTGYADSYEVLHAALRRAAEREWAVYRERRERGIEIDSPYRLVLLHPDAQFEVRGDGTEFVRVDYLDREDLPPVLEIVPTTEVPDPVPFSVELFYPNDRRETVRFLVTGSSGENRVPGAGVVNALLGALGRRLVDDVPDYCDAGTSDDQRLYHPAVSGDCEASTGAVAWALLYGWADHQACIDNPTWTDRWGLYREGGDEAPAPDEDAPRTPTSGTDSVVRELQDLIGRCHGTTGSTEITEMGKAETFIIGRSAAAAEGRSTELLPKRELAEIAIGSICEMETPAVVGTGGGEYVLAWKYRNNDGIDQFYVNQGDGDRRGDWIPADTAFYCGLVCPSGSECDRLTP